MCGFIAIFDKTGELKAADVRYATDTIAHRGPDGYDYLFTDNVLDASEASRKFPMFNHVAIGLGHRRLAIQDLSEEGHQPMTYLDRYIIVFNGEIYNFKELRTTLISAGYIFHTHTDTEVILAAYDYWHEECIQRFNGMWSFVILDQQRQSVFVSRDRFGIKPLYYYRDAKHIVFASEIKAILTLSFVEAKPNLPYLRTFYKKGFSVKGSETAFKGICRFRKCSYLSAHSYEDLFSAWQLQRFWDYKPNTEKVVFDPAQAQQYADQYYALLKDAVRIRLRADVEIGAALSGGLDSSSIVYLINEILREDGNHHLLKTFSSVYKSEGVQDCDESEFIDLLADELSVANYQIEPTVDAVPAEHDKMIRHFELPPENTMMSNWHTFQLVSQEGVKVTLDGQAADEQLAGYLVYMIPYLSNLSLADLKREIKAFKRIPGANRFVCVGALANIVARVLGKRLTEKLLNKFVPLPLCLSLNEQLYHDTDAFLGRLLHFADSASMGYSVESRMPFMDYRLVEFLSQIPAVYKMHNGWTKYIARLAFDKKLPDAIAWREDKMGWPIPEKRWFEGKLNLWLQSILMQSPFLKRYFSTALTDFEESQKSGAELNIKQSLRLLNIAVWAKHFLKN